MDLLIGRERELAELRRLLASCADRGHAVLLSGAPGIGKTALADDLARSAQARKLIVRRTAGSPAESQLPFAGLHALVAGWLPDLPGVPFQRRQALLSAFGLAESGPVPPEPFLIGLSVLDLLSAAAAETPVLILVEDAHWLDPETAQVLAFVSRRLPDDPVLLLATARPGYRNALIDTIDEVMEVGPLSHEAATQLLEQTGPGLSAEARARVLRWAQGNPLALLELPNAAAEPGSGPAPTTARLQRTFTTRSLSLIAPVRAALLAAALDERAGLAEILAAARDLTGTGVDATDLKTAVDAGLIRLDEKGLTFRHALVRTAVFEDADGEQRRQAHLSLARVLTEQPERRAWHLAVVSPAPDADLADELERIAAAARRRGGLSAALAAQRHAIRLSPRGPDRVRRLLDGGELAFQLGERHLLRELLAEVDPSRIGAADAARLEYLDEVFDFRPWTAQTILAAVDRARAASAAGHPQAAVTLLRSVVARANLQGTDEQVLTQVTRTLDELDLPPDQPASLLVYAFAAPVERGAALLKQLREALPAATGNGEQLYELAMAAGPVGDSHLQVAAMTGAVEQLRRAGRVATLAPALWALGSAQYFTGDWPAGAMAAAESARLGADTLQPLWESAALLSEAVFAAGRGDTQRASALIEQVSTTMPLFGPSQVARARGTLALAEERYDEAYTSFARLFVRDDPAYHSTLRSWVAVELAEAAVATGRRAEASAVLAELVGQLELTPAPRLHASLAAARALLSGEDEDLYIAATRPELAVWPFVWARAQLAYGAWLRRRRRIAESRIPLRAAREQFDRLGAAPWGERARRELRAAGERSPDAAPGLTDLLTVQELQIATLAAQGLTNREIGSRLFLSHRTVGTYLYQVFPKLGVTSRQQLNAALARGR